MQQAIQQIDQPALTNDDIEALLTSPGEVLSELKKLALRKSPREDAVFNAAARNLPRKAVVQLTNIVNAALRLSYYPKSWKIALVVPVQKLSNPKELPTSYRPISLLSTLSKIAEKVILTHLIEYPTESHTLLDQQMGYRANTGTAHVTTILATETIEVSNKRFIAALALDTEKAAATQRDTTNITLQQNHTIQTHNTIKQRKTQTTCRFYPQGGFPC